MRLALAALALNGCDILGGSGDIGVDTGIGFANCGDQSFSPLDEGFEVHLTPDGCRWMVTAADRSGYIALSLDVPAFAELFEGESVSTTYTLPDDVVRLEVAVGCGVDEGTCEASTIQSEVTRTYTATAGTVVVEGSPDGDGGVVDVTLTDVELESNEGDTVSLTVTWTDVELYPAPTD